MIKLDDDLLKELGLEALPPDEKKKMLAHIYETLEMRVGVKLAEQMSDAQLNEFESFIATNDEAGALRWLEANFPNYKDVVSAEFETLKAEIKQVAPQILANAANAAMAPTMPPLTQGTTSDDDDGRADSMPNPQQTIPPSEPQGRPY